MYTYMYMYTQPKAGEGKEHEQGVCVRVSGQGTGGRAGVCRPVEGWGEYTPDPWKEGSGH